MLVSLTSHMCICVDSPAFSYVSSPPIISDNVKNTRCIAGMFRQQNAISNTYQELQQIGTGGLLGSPRRSVFGPSRRSLASLNFPRYRC